MLEKEICMCKELNRNDLKQRCLIISDLDATLLNNKSELSEKTIETVKKVTAAGHVFCIATGRPYRGSYMFYDQLNLDSIIINYNGASMSKPYDAEFKPINFQITSELVKQLLTDPKNRSLIKNAMIENNYGTLFLTEPETEVEKMLFLQQFHVDTNIQLKVMGENFNNFKGDAYAVLIQLKDHTQDKIDELIYNIKSFTSTLICRNWTIPGLGSIIEINSLFSTKGTAIRFLSSYYGIPLEKCFAFGDGDNDNEMLKTAGFGFAMRNGTTTAKLSAKFLTEYSNNDDGVAHELNRLFELQVAFNETKEKLRHEKLKVVKLKKEIQKAKQIAQKTKKINISSNQSD